MLKFIKTQAVRFTKEEDGLALTEYLILLGLLTGAVILAVVAFGSALANTWNTWGTFFTTWGVGAPVSG
jgi:pilus assembly protein Flp/PilA